MKEAMSSYKSGVSLWLNLNSLKFVVLAEIRAKLKEQEAGQGGNRGPQGPNPIYPFWNMTEGSSATLRFLPDGNPDNTFFWAKYKASVFAGFKAALID